MRYVPACAGISSRYDRDEDKSGLVTAQTFEQLYWLMYGKLHSEDFSGYWNLRDVQARQDIAILQ